ncbi:uncharacterized protein LOC126816015 [Patella vulgata]|uniref:uncharacterized protein LOC126816015 n=1 Tax=Patella vulgata TaxID=6465 RepID=UPI00217F246F|nr:uncharacterized protein LOC126816015 [Patella vulgata]
MGLLSSLFLILCLSVKLVLTNKFENVIQSFVEIQKETKYHTPLSKLLGKENKEPEDENLNHPVSGTIAGDELLEWSIDDRTIKQIDGGIEEDLEKRKTVSLEYLLWPGGIVPWQFCKNARRKFRNTTSRAMVLKAMKHWEERTCLKFIPISVISKEQRPAHYVDIGRGSGCASPVGFKQAGQQPIYLNEQYCIQFGTIVHEIGHTIGFFHEHARRDRGEYININTDNVKDDFISNFREAVYSVNTTMYDLGSNMHYGPKFFSSNGKNTITSKDPDLSFLMGRRIGLTFLDTKAANLAYKCKEKCKNPVECENAGFLLHTCNCYCAFGLSGRTCNKIKDEFSSDCSGIIELGFGETRVISSPGYPKPPPIAKCFWLIKAEANNRIQIELTLDLASDRLNHICLHWIGVRYNHIGQVGPRYCGTTSKPVNITSKSNMISAVLNAQYKIKANEHQGFTLKLTAIGAIDKGIKCLFKKGEKCPFYPDDINIMKWEIMHGLFVESGMEGASFLVAKTSYFPKPDTRVLKSADIKGGKWCFCFGYYLPEEETGNVLVLVTSKKMVNSRPSMIWMNENYQPDFQTVCLNIKYQDVFKILVKIYLRKNNMMILSNITLGPNMCEKSNKVYSVAQTPKVAWRCDFEESMCGLRQCYSPAEMTWERMNVFPMFGPKSGHRSAKSDPGDNWFMVRNGWFKPRASVACVQSPDIYLENTKNCLQFYFYVWGYSTGNVTIDIIEDNDIQTEIWSFDRLGLQNIEWSLFQVPITVSGNIKLEIKTKLRYWWGSYAIDDIKITETAC